MATLLMDARSQRIEREMAQVMINAVGAQMNKTDKQQTHWPQEARDLAIQLHREGRPAKEICAEVGEKFGRNLNVSLFYSWLQLPKASKPPAKKTKIRAANKTRPIMGFNTAKAKAERLRAVLAATVEEMKRQDISQIALDVEGRCHIVRKESEDFSL